MGDADARWVCDLCTTTYYTYGAAAMCEETCQKHAQRRALASAKAALRAPSAAACVNLPAWAEASEAGAEAKRASVEEMSGVSAPFSPPLTHDASAPLRVAPAPPPGEGSSSSSSGGGDTTRSRVASSASASAPTPRDAADQLRAFRSEVEASVAAQLTAAFDAKYASVEAAHADSLRVHEMTIRAELAAAASGAKGEGAAADFITKLRAELLDSERRSARTEEQLAERNTQLGEARRVAEKERELRMRERAQQLAQLGALGEEAASEKAAAVHEQRCAAHGAVNELTTKAVAASEARARDAESRAERLEEQCATLVERVQRATAERDEFARQCAMVTSQLDLFETALGDRLYGAP